MKRLTTDTPQNLMETALNLFFAKDGEAWVRGGGTVADISLFDFTREAIKNLCKDSDGFAYLPDEEMGEILLDWAGDGYDSVESIIGTLYTAGWAFAEIRARLKQYEDTGLTPEEVMIYAKSRTEGRVLELPCQIGATVYELRRKYEDYRGRKYDHSLTGCSNFRRFIRSDEIYVAPKCCTKSDFNWLGKTVFLSEEEAKATLEERKNA